ncbi:hypothetical protein [Pseudomonas moorei]|uniref:Uncharacterized protein n=1 Tax=Pseudomonas moorei TaxID=395599 RepID=A0A1H1FIN4_9PSED|nr:hypothetical protein [Pseudomonas moorei]KAB0509676.1 hypothetical protein F7R06_01245 [Pseudomonas moorei]SDR00704.1 hypothetical protein SAMN04490195_2722 [Pseudomonas moorei]
MNTIYVLCYDILDPGIELMLGWFDDPVLAKSTAESMTTAWHDRIRASRQAGYDGEPIPHSENYFRSYWVEELQKL